MEKCEKGGKKRDLSDGVLLTRAQISDGSEISRRTINESDGISKRANPKSFMFSRCAGPEFHKNGLSPTFEPSRLLPSGGCFAKAKLGIIAATASTSPALVSMGLRVFAP